MAKKIKIEIDESSFEEILIDIHALIGMRSMEGFENGHNYGLLKYLIACAKKQCGLSYKIKGDFLYKKTLLGWRCI